MAKLPTITLSIVKPSSKFKYSEVRHFCKHLDNVGDWQQIWICRFCGARYGGHFNSPLFDLCTACGEHQGKVAGRLPNDEKYNWLRAPARTTEFESDDGKTWIGLELKHEYAARLAQAESKITAAHGGQPPDTYDLDINGPTARPIEVCVNGRRISDCVAYSVTAGWARVYTRDLDNKQMIFKGSAQMHVIRGRVTVSYGKPRKQPISKKGWPKWLAKLLQR